MNMDFEYFLLINEAERIIAEYELLYLTESPLLQKTLQRKAIDPVTGKNWRYSDANRQIKTIVNDQKKLGVPMNKIFITYSNVPKLGVNPRAGNGATPFGIYAYPASFVLERDLKHVPYGSDRDYIHIFKAKNNAKIMQMPKGPKEESKKDAFKEIKKSILSTPDKNELEALRKDVAKILSDLYQRHNLRATPAMDPQNTATHIIDKYNSLFHPNSSVSIEDTEESMRFQLDRLDPLGYELNRIITKIESIGLDGNIDEDYYNPRKYTKINFKEKTAEYNQQFLTQNKIEQRKVSFDEICSTVPSLKEMWDNYKKNSNPDFDKDRDHTVDTIVKALIKQAKKVLDNKDNAINSTPFPHKEELMKMAERYGIQDWKSVLTDAMRDSKNFTDFLYKITQRIASRTSNTHITWTKLLRELGVDGMADRYDGGRIHTAERSQAFFFELKNLEMIKTINTQAHNPEYKVTHWDYQKQKHVQSASTIQGRRTGYHVQYGTNDNQMARTIKGITASLRYAIRTVDSYLIYPHTASEDIRIFDNRLSQLIIVLKTYNKLKSYNRDRSGAPNKLFAAGDYSLSKLPNDIEFFQHQIQNDKNWQIFWRSPLQKLNIISKLANAEAVSTGHYNKSKLLDKDQIDNAFPIAYQGQEIAQKLDFGNEPVNELKSADLATLISKLDNNSVAKLLDYQASKGIISVHQGQQFYARYSKLDLKLIQQIPNFRNLLVDTISNLKPITEFSKYIRSEKDIQSIIQALKFCSPDSSFYEMEEALKTKMQQNELFMSPEYKDVYTALEGKLNTPITYSVLNKLGEDGITKYKQLMNNSNSSYLDAYNRFKQAAVATQLTDEELDSYLKLEPPDVHYKHDFETLNINSPKDWAKYLNFYSKFKKHSGYSDYNYKYDQIRNSDPDVW